LYTPSFFITHTEIYDPETIARMKGMVQAVVEEYGIEYHDFGIHPAISPDPTFFRDDDHLVQNAAQLFSFDLWSAMEHAASAGHGTSA